MLDKLIIILVLQYVLMSDLKNERIYASKPYDMIAGVSIFPLNENGVRNYLKNKVVDNQIIKRYGTMDFLENCDRAREKKLKENISKNLSEVKSFAVNKGKTSSNWNDDFLTLKNKFKDDIVKMDNIIEVIKDKKNNSIICNNNISIEQNPNSRKLKELTKKFSNMNSKDKLSKSQIKRKFADGFTSTTIPRLATCEEKIKNKYFLKLMKNNHESDLTRSTSSNIFPKVLDDRRRRDTSSEKNYANPWNLIKTTQPEFAYNSNIKGDCKMMGERYNPFNYYVDNTRTTKRRNLYGSVYNN